MKNQRLFTLLTITLLFVFVFSLFSPAIVLADETTPPAPTEEPSATEEPVSTEAVSSAVPEADTPSEILESAPEGVDVVVLDENGNPMTLTTEEAAQVILAGDPIWCPDDLDGTPQDNPTPGANGCTPTNTTFTALLTDLNAGTYAGNGTIFVAWDYASAEGEVTFDHTDPKLSTLGNLTIQGGWEFGSGMHNGDAAYQSTLNGTWLNIDNWVGNVTVNNIFIENAAGIGLDITTEGDVNLNDVRVEDSEQDGARIDSGGDVTVTNSRFNNNGFKGNTTEALQEDIPEYSYEFFMESGIGLDIYSDGDITLNDVSAEYNAGHGASLMSKNSDIEVIDSSFNENGFIGDFYFLSYYDTGDPDYNYYASFYINSETGSGLLADTDGGDITLTNVIANLNANNGAILNPYYGAPDGNVQVVRSNFDRNGGGCGVFCEAPESLGFIFDDFLYDSDNGQFCDLTNFFTQIFNPCIDSNYIEVQGPNFSYQIDAFETTDGVLSNSYSLFQNGGTGLIVSGNEVTLDNVAADENSSYGAAIDAAGDVSVRESSFEENGGLGSLFLSEAIYDNYNYFSDENPYDNTYPYSDLNSAYLVNFYYGYDDGLSIYSSAGDISLIDMFVLGNARTGIDVYTSDGSVLVQNVDSVENGRTISIGGAEGLFGEFLYDKIGLDFTLELPASEINVFVGVGLYDDYNLDEINASVNLESGAGLYAGGNEITLKNVAMVANLGEGAHLFSYGNINISQAGFYANGAGIEAYLYGQLNDEVQEFGFGLSNGSGLSASAEGNITLFDVTSEENVLHGAQLNSDGGSIFVENSYFNFNGYNGFMGDGFYNYGYMYSDGIDYEEEFGDGYGSGLFIYTYGGGDVTLINVEANVNNMDGATVTSGGGRVIVSCGQYDDNGDYGIHEHDASSLELYGPEILNNGYSPDEYYFSGNLILSDDCTIPTVMKQDGEGDGDVCAGNEANTFIMPNGDYVTFPCPVKDYAVVSFLGEAQLPATLSSDFSFISALHTEVYRDDKLVKKLSKAAIISFIIPEGVEPESLTILFWNGEEWADLGGVVSADGLYFTVTTNLLGTFVLASK